MNALIPLAGLAAGSLHVLSGPDHLAAMAPLAVRDPARATRLGASWGLGHGLGVVALGALGALARGRLDLDAWSARSEQAVGFLLIAVGCWAIWRARKVLVHTHPHHGHSHAHLHLGDESHEGALHSHAALGVGALHGLAGAGHLLGVLPSLALPPAQAAIYLATYLLAAVLSMAAFARAVGAIAGRIGAGALRGLAIASGLCSVAVGGWWIASTTGG